jgi:hypothetical protein
MNAANTVTANFALIVATSVSVASASGQYSDPVTLSATLGPSGLVAMGSLQFAVNGVAAGAAIPVSGAGTYTTSYTIGLAQGNYTISAAFTSGTPLASNSSGSNTLAVSRENATMTPSSTNPQAVQVNTAGGTAGPVTLTASIKEVADGSLGDISKATASVTLVPVVAGGGNITCPVTDTGGGVGGTLTVTAVCPNTVAVNVYDMQWRITGNYYQGQADSVLAIYDPSLGFVTGGGTVLDNAVPAEFAMNVKYLKSGNIQGGMIYIEHRQSGDVVVKTNSLTSLSVISTAVLLSKATVNGVGGYAIQATAIDNGTPGVNNDKFGLQVSGSPNAAIVFAPQLITGGNIQVPHTTK